MNQEHTPLPWKTAGRFAPVYIVGAKERVIADCDGIASLPDLDGPNMIANAAFIVRACNNHYRLLEALEVAAAQIEWLSPGNTALGDPILARLYEAIRLAKGE